MNITNQFEEILLSSTGSQEIVKTELIQELWSGYGQLARVTTDKKSIIAKLIKFPTEQDHPRGWNSDFGHRRKVKSYEVEMNWYKDHNTEIEDAYSPRYITSGKSEDMQYLLLEDLKDQNFETKSSINFEQIKLCLKWLAEFHKKYMGHTPEGLWKTGTYWHLETRPDELNAMDDFQMKHAAPLIDQRLQSAKFKTIVHGDAKLANFLFNDTSVAAVDFQYVGGGVGVKDLAYFLSSIYDENDLIENEEKCLNYYFQELDNKEIEAEWRELYPFAWTDFYRFLKGWSPGHWKINTYTERMKEKVFQCL